jgi:hypothetical protein
MGEISFSIVYLVYYESGSDRCELPSSKVILIKGKQLMFGYRGYVLPPHGIQAKNSTKHGGKFSYSCLYNLWLFKHNNKWVIINGLTRGCFEMIMTGTSMLRRRILWIFEIL